MLLQPGHFSGGDACGPQEGVGGSHIHAPSSEPHPAPPPGPGPGHPVSSAAVTPPALPVLPAQGGLWVGHSFQNC